MVQLLFVFLIIFTLYYFLLHDSELCHPLCLFTMLFGSSSQSSVSPVHFFLLYVTFPSIPSATLQPTFSTLPLRK